MRRLLFTALCAISIAPAASIQHATLTAFQTATSGLQQSTIDFTNVTISDQNMYGYTEDGATFTGKASNGTNYLYGRTYSGGFIYGAFGTGYIRVDLPTGTIGAAFDMDRFYGLAHPTDFILSTGETFTLTPSSGFVGFTNLNCIAYIDIRVQTGAPNGVYGYTSDSPIIYNAYLAVDPEKTPEPGPAGLVGVSMAALAVACSRRRGN